MSHGGCLQQYFSTHCPASSSRTLLCWVFILSTSSFLDLLTVFLCPLHFCLFPLFPFRSSFLPWSPLHVFSVSFINVPESTDFSLLKRTLWCSWSAWLICGGWVTWTSFRSQWNQEVGSSVHSTTFRRYLPQQSRTSLLSHATSTSTSVYHILSVSTFICLPVNCSLSASTFVFL